MHCYSGTEVVRDRMLGDCTVMAKRMNGTSDKTGQLLIREGLCVEHTADADGGGEDMHLSEFAGLRIHQKLRLVTAPVDVYSSLGIRSTAIRSA